MLAVTNSSVPSMSTAWRTVSRSSFGHRARVEPLRRPDDHRVAGPPSAGLRRGEDHDELVTAEPSEQGVPSDRPRRAGATSR